MKISKCEKNNNRALEYGRFVLKDIKVNGSLYIMFIPVLAFYILFAYVPMYGISIAFMDYSPFRGMTGSEFVGFKHFISFLTNPSFFGILRNTLKFSITSLIFGFPAPIIFALLLNELRSPKFSKIVQNITYLPHFISLVVICSLVKMFTMDTGIVTQFLTLFGFEAKTLLNEPEYFLPTYIISEIWQGLGWGSIIYLAALTGIDSSLIEAATIDGAGKWKQVIHITIPSIMPTIMMMLILRIGGILSVGYEKIILLWNDMTRDTANVISTYVYQQGLLGQRWSYSTAVNTFNSLVNLILLVSANTLSRKVNESSLW